MRSIADIPHPQCKISVFYMNQKYIVKVEKRNLEQSFKVSGTDLLGGLDDIHTLFGEEMIGRILLRFKEMEKDWGEALAAL